MLTAMKQLRKVSNLLRKTYTPPLNRLGEYDAFAFRCRQLYNLEILRNLNKENITTAVNATRDTHNSFGTPL